MNYAAFFCPGGAFLKWDPEPMPFDPEQPPLKDTRRTKWFPFFVYLAGSAFLISVLVDSKLNFSNWGDWFLVLGTIISMVYTVIAGLSLVRDWSDTEENLAVLAGEKTMSWLIGAPIIVLVGVWLLGSVVGWFSSIPSWAAVIIALLVLLLLRR